MNPCFLKTKKKNDSWDIDLPQTDQIGLGNLLLLSCALFFFFSALTSPSINLWSGN